MVEAAGSRPVTQTKEESIGFCLSALLYSAVNDAKLSFALAKDMVGLELGERRT